MDTSQLDKDIDITTWALQCLAQNQKNELREALIELHLSQIVQLFESVPTESRSELLLLLSEQNSAAVLSLLHDEVRNPLIQSMDPPQLASVAVQMAPIDLADVIEDLPEDITDSLLEALDTENRARVNAVREYPDGTAGRIMSTDASSVRPDVSLSVVLRWLRKQDQLPPYTTSLMVIDTEGKYLGKLPMSLLLTGDPSSTVESVMLSSSEVINVNASEHEVARLFDQRHLISVAVLDAEEYLVGRITVDHAMDILKKEADLRLLTSGGLSEDEADLFAPIVPSAKQRGIWLGINLVTVFIAAWVIGQFQDALDQIVALAVLMPIVASMGGIAGSQTLTLTIRGLALDQIVKGNVRWLVSKELGVGALNGIAWSIVVALVTYLWFNNIGLSLIIAAALILNLIVASLSGVVVPLCLNRLGYDPALSGAVVLTTVTDIVGFLSFLGLASWFLL